MKYDILCPWNSLDDWQKEYIDTDGDCFLLCGRQVGKSTAASIKAVELAVNKHKKGEDILIIATTERQAYNLFSKCLAYAMAKYPSKIKKGKEKPTKHELNFTTGVKLMCHPTGLMGEGLRGFTLKKIFADEASRMSREIFISILPMLSVTGGSIDVLSTPCGKQGYFYECSQNPKFKQFYVSSEDCPRHKPDFLEGEKKRMSQMEYAQEYMAVFLDDLQRLFSDNLIKKVCRLKRCGIIKENRHYLGVDLARMGKDESTFEIIDRISKEEFIQTESIITTKTLTTETENKIIELDTMWNFKEIDIDAGSGTLGVSIFDHLLENDQIKRKIKATNNRARSMDRDDSRKSKLLKEDLYMNLIGMLERGELKLLDDDEIILSLKSVQYEYVVKEGQPTKLRIFGNYTHVVEGLIRAAWAASRDKTLNIWVR